MIISRTLRSLVRITRKQEKDMLKAGKKAAKKELKK
jgi:hypothetical protein